MLRAVVGYLIVLVACGCDGTVAWVIERGVGVSSTGVRIEAEIREGGCEGTTVVWGTVLAGGDAMAPPDLPAGRYGLAAKVIDEMCRVVGEGCDFVDIPSDGDRVVVVMNRVDPPRELCAADRCVCGVCDGPPGCSDAGTDAAGTDGGPPPDDAGPRDAGGCVPATEICNGADDDCDGVVDEADADMDGARCFEDCDDSDPARNDNLREVCGDGIDNDCSGAPETDEECCPGSATFDAENRRCVEGPFPAMSCAAASAFCLPRGSCPGSPPLGSADGPYWIADGSQRIACAHGVYSSGSYTSGGSICGGSPTCDESRAFYCTSRTALPSALVCTRGRECGVDERCDAGVCRPESVIEPRCCFDLDCSGSLSCEIVAGVTHGGRRNLSEPPSVGACR